MINKTTRIVDNKFYVDFDVKPKDIQHKRQYSGEKAYTATHIGGGTTRRKGIKEGIEIKSIKTKTGDYAWRNRDIENTITSWTSYNDKDIKISVTYTLKCMGWHWKDYDGYYPFFWFGNISGVPYKYRLGSFRDSKPANPGMVHTICAVPSDWKLVNMSWTDWAYKHGQDTPNYEESNGRYEKRNMSHDTSSETTKTGWLSDSGYSQITRKSMMFTFEKTYTMTVTSKGIATHPDPPVLSVQYAKGDSGKITVKHIDPANKSGTVKVNAICKEKTVEVISYSNSGTIANNASKTFTIDFNKHFGESYRGNDIKYEAWSKNSLGYECKKSSGIKGVHRYNGRPGIPTELKVEGMSEGDIIYDYINFYWKHTTDPDNDVLTYEIWLKATNEEGKVTKNGTIATNIKDNKYLKFDIQNYSDKTIFEVKVRASDGQLYGDWSEIYKFEKGAVPKGSLALIAPCVSDSILYNVRPRFFFEGYDGTSSFIFVYNSQEYSSDINPEMFSKSDNKVVFKPNFDMKKNKAFTCYGYMKNKYGSSKKSSSFKFIIKDPIEKITEGNIIQASVINEVYNLMKEFANAYRKSFNDEVKKEDIVKADTFNKCNILLKDTATYLNNLISTNTFDYVYDLTNVIPGEQLNDDALWDNLVSQLTKI